MHSGRMAVPNIMMSQNENAVGLPIPTSWSMDELEPGSRIEKTSYT